MSIRNICRDPEPFAALPGLAAGIVAGVWVYKSHPEAALWEQWLAIIGTAIAAGWFLKESRWLRRLFGFVIIGLGIFCIIAIFDNG